jgi:hypothetical protein
MNQKPHDDYAKRAAANDPLIEGVQAVLQYEAESRAAQKSWGRQAVEILWEDGFIRVVNLNDGRIIKPGNKFPGAQKPGETLDS